MPDMFDQSMQPGMSPDPMFAATQAVNFQATNNALQLQQQQMLQATQASISPGYYNPMAGSMMYNPSTMQIASNQMMQGMSNVFQGTMQASSQLMQAFSGMGNAANRFVVGSKYNDVYDGPNNFALESSMRRELGSAMGFTHETPLGRLLLGGFRPDFMTDRAFANQMQAARETRFSASNMADFGITGAATIAGFAAGGILPSLIAAPIGALVARGVNSTEFMRHDRAEKEAWERDVNMRYGFGAEGYFDKKTSGGVARWLSEQEEPDFKSAFFGKSISRKLGWIPEVSAADTKSTMENLGMFSMRSGAYNAGDVTSAVRSITDSMKELAGIAKVLKEEIPKAAAELQKAGGFTFNQSAQYMGLTRQAANVAGMTGIDLNKIVSAQAQMMQVGLQNGFSAMQVGSGIAQSIGQITALKAAGMMSQNIDPINAAQTLQMNAMQNQRTNFFAQFKPGETYQDAQNRAQSSPGSFLTQQNQPNLNDRSPLDSALNTFNNFIKEAEKAAGSYGIEQAGGLHNFRLTMARTAVMGGLTGLTPEMQQNIVRLSMLDEETNRNVIEKDEILAAEARGDLSKIFGEKRAKEMVREVNSRSSNVFGDFTDRVKNGSTTSFTDEENADKIFRSYGGLSAVRERLDGGINDLARGNTLKDHPEDWDTSSEANNSTIKALRKTDNYLRFVALKGGDPLKAEREFFRLARLSDQEYRTETLGEAGSAIARQILEDSEKQLPTEEILKRSHEIAAKYGVKDVDQLVGRGIQGSGRAEVLKDLAGLSSDPETRRLQKLKAKFQESGGLNYILQTGKTGIYGRDFDTLDTQALAISRETKRATGAMTSEEAIARADEIASHYGEKGEAYNTRVRNFILERSGVANYINEQLHERQESFAVGSSNRTVRDNALFQKLASGGRDWAEEAVNKIGGKKRAVLQEIIDGRSGGWKDEFTRIYDEELKKGTKAGEAFQIAQKQSGDYAYKDLSTIAASGKLTEEQQGVVQRALDYNREKSGDVGKAMMVIAAKNERDVGQKGQGEIENKLATNLWRTLRDPFGVNLSQRQIDEDVASLYDQKHHKYGSYIRGKDDVTKLKSDQLEQYFKEFRGNKTALAALASAGGKMAEVAHDIEAGTVKDAAGTAQLIQQAQQKLGWNKLPSVNSDNVDLSDKRVAADAIGTLNELLKAIAVAMHVPLPAGKDEAGKPTNTIKAIPRAKTAQGGFEPADPGKLINK